MTLPRIYMCQIKIIFFHEINQRVECLLSIFPSEAIAGRARNAVLPRVFSRCKDCSFQVGTVLMNARCFTVLSCQTTISLSYQDIGCQRRLKIIQTSLIIKQTNRNFIISSLFNDYALGMSMKWKIHLLEKYLSNICAFFPRRHISWCREPALNKIK